MYLMDMWKNKTIIIVLAAVVAFAGWFGYTVWQRSSETVSEWRSADEEMKQLLAQHSAVNQNQPAAVPNTDQAHVEQRSSASEKNSEPSYKVNSSPLYNEISDPIVPAKSETARKAAAEENQPGSSTKLNLNTATAEQLTALPGIGESKANAIIAYRLQIGGRFKSAEQLLDVKGIGDKVLAKLKPYLTVDP